MTSIQQLKEHVIRLNDERLLNQFDIYNNFNFRDTKEIIYYKIIEYELHKRRLLDHKIMEDNYEYEYAQ
jgi:hypothetical protein